MNSILGTKQAKQIIKSMEKLQEVKVELNVTDKTYKWNTRLIQRLVDKNIKD